MPHKPQGYSTLTPYLIVSDGVAALDFYAEAFGAAEAMRLTLPKGGVAHAEMTIGDSRFMLAGVTPDMNLAVPEAGQWPTVSMVVYFEDCDAAYERALAAGAVSEKPPADQFYGDRAAKVRDAFGHSWSLMTNVESLTPDEVQQRLNEMFAAPEED